MSTLTPRDWRDIQEAVSNSDLPNERRIALLDKIDTAACEWPRQEQTK